ncbi:hypothetical protein [Ralstonia soli]|uniref:Uncharacterized protein n=1 Tax=Ralstonia soli TaxID=2953896 RepID=A0ABT1AJJ8_9RALS|nr:hypothetical protein [Ralstonia soli]MCO5398571.1 hypothetical protein [Ralstonia soli]
MISIQLAAADLTAIDGALKTLEDRLTGLIDLSPEQRRRAVKMGGKSETFARTAVEVLTNNPNVLPVNFSLPEVRRDLAAFDALRPRFARLEKLYERMSDSQLALGSDLMSAALDVSVSPAPSRRCERKLPE